MLSQIYGIYIHMKGLCHEQNVFCLLKKFFFIILKLHVCIYVCVWVSVCEYSCLQRLGVSDISAAGVTGDHNLPDVGAEN